MCSDYLTAKPTKTIEVNNKSVMKTLDHVLGYLPVSKNWLFTLHEKKQNKNRHKSSKNNLVHYKFI
jgi:hypothetical protein